MASPIEIVGVGARTPAGVTAPASAAAVRAKMTMLVRHPFMVDCVGDMMPGALDPEIDPIHMGPERLIRLAEGALREACLPFGDRGTPRIGLPVYLGLPEIRPGFTERDAETVRNGLSQLEGLPVKIVGVRSFAQGHAAGLSALASAVQDFRQGAVEACLVGGVESYFHPDTMEWLDENRQLMGAVSRSGFVPGEGAGFCLLATDKAQQRLGLKGFLRVHSAALGRETKLIKTTDMCFSDGLAATVADALKGLRPPDERIHEIYCDINGERYRGEEWGFVCLRLSHYFDAPTAYISPADCWGDVGAASGPLFMMLACQAVARNYAKGSRTMVWGSSEKGLRGVAVLEALGGE